MRSPLKLFLLIYIVLELIVFYMVCKLVGVLLAVILVILSSVFGTGLLRVNGVETMYRAQQKAAQGEHPAGEMMKGFAISFGAILLIIPGFITSILGLLLVIPGTRRFLGSLFVKGKWFRTRPAGFNQNPKHQSANDTPENNQQSGRVIEGEFKED